MENFSESLGQSPAPVNDMGDTIPSVSGDDVASVVEQSTVDVQRHPYAGPVGSVVVYPGDAWSRLATYYRTDVDTLRELNPDIGTDDIISGMVSEFRVPFTRFSR